MSKYTIEFNNVWKKFRRGEHFDSLRDLIPSMVKRIFSSNGASPALKKNEFWALKDVSFKVQRGEVLGIIGPNGAGKSTIFKIISKILKPDKGEVITKGRVSALIEVGAGFHPDLTGRENVYLNGTILGMSKKEIEQKFNDIVDFAGLREFIDTPVKRYSSGMQARLGFAIASYLEAEILIVDEVLAVGDLSFQKKCFQKMQDVTLSGKTVLLVSHNMAAINSFCHTCLWLDSGKVVALGPAKEVVREYISNYQTQYTKSVYDLSMIKRSSNLPNNVKITRVEIRCGDNRQCRQPVVGEKVLFKFFLSKSFRVSRFIFAIYDIYGNLITDFDSKFRSSKDKIFNSEISLIECEVSQFFLTPGRYFMNIALLSNRGLEDYCPGAINIEVQSGLMCGRPIDNSYRGVAVMDYFFTLK